MNHIYKLFHSPNTDSQQIHVQFLILHYTAAGLNQTLEIFKDAQSKVSCHFVIDRDGSFYEVLPCLEGKPIKAYHSGDSFWTDLNNVQYSCFNEISLGIELVNFNGHLFPFTDSQYSSLNALVLKLKNIYPALKNPQHVLGHEHIAGFRGKIDPGSRFDWLRFFKNAYPEISQHHYPNRTSILPRHLQEKFKNFVEKLPHSEKKWSELNVFLEKQYCRHLKQKKHQ